MAYNHGKEERKWRIWKEAKEKILRQYRANNLLRAKRHPDRE